MNVVVVKDGKIVSVHPSAAAGRRAEKRNGGEWGYVAVHPTGFKPEPVVGMVATRCFENEGGWLIQ